MKLNKRQQSNWDSCPLYRCLVQLPRFPALGLRPVGSLRTESCDPFRMKTLLLLRKSAALDRAENGWPSRPFARCWPSNASKYLTKGAQSSDAHMGLSRRFPLRVGGCCWGRNAHHSGRTRTPATATPSLVRASRTPHQVVQGPISWMGNVDGPKPTQFTASASPRRRRLLRT